LNPDHLASVLKLKYASSLFSEPLGCGVGAALEAGSKRGDGHWRDQTVRGERGVGAGGRSTIGGGAGTHSGRYPTARVAALGAGRTPLEASLSPGCSGRRLARAAASPGSRFALDHHIPPGWRPNQGRCLFRIAAVRGASRVGVRKKAIERPGSPAAGAERRHVEAMDSRPFRCAAAIPPAIQRQVAARWR